jgi:hypothetical protein
MTRETVHYAGLGSRAPRRCVPVHLYRSCGHRGIPEPGTHRCQRYIPGISPFRVVVCTVLVLLRCSSFRLHQPWNCAVSSRSLHGETLATQTQSCALQSICHGAVSSCGLYGLVVAPLQQFRVAPAREWLHRSGVVWGSVPVVSAHFYNVSDKAPEASNAQTNAPSARTVRSHFGFFSAL